MMGYAYAVFLSVDAQNIPWLRIRLTVIIAIRERIKSYNFVPLRRRSSLVCVRLSSCKALSVVIIVVLFTFYLNHLDFWDLLWLFNRFLLFCFFNVCNWIKYLEFEPRGEQTASISQHKASLFQLESIHAHDCLQQINFSVFDAQIGQHEREAKAKDREKVAEVQGQIARPELLDRQINGCDNVSIVVFRYVVPQRLPVIRLVIIRLTHTSDERLT